MKKHLLLPLLTSSFLSIGIGKAATITDVSNNDGGIVTVIDGTTGAEDIDSAATGATTLSTVNSNLDYVISNWGSSTWDNDTNTLQNVGGLLDITISETFPSNKGWDPSTQFVTTGTSSIASDFDDNVSFTIDFSTDVVTAGFVLSNLGGAYDSSDATNPGFIRATFHTGADGTGTTLSTQTFADGGADTNGGDDSGQKDAFFGLSGAGNFRSIVVEIQRDANSGSGGVGVDDLGFAVVPEPSTFALFGLAGLAAMFAARRRR